MLKAGDAVFLISADLDDFRKELQAATLSIKEFGKIAEKIGKDTGQSIDQNLGKAPKEAAKQFSLASKEITDGLKSISMKSALMGTAIIGALGGAAKKASDYRSSLNQIRVLGVKDMETVDAAIRRVAKTFGTDLTETATVAKDAISTFGTEGEGLADSLTYVEQSAKAAAAGYVGLSDAARATTSILKVFNLNTNQTLEVMDALKVATDLGITDMQRFAPEVSKLNVQFQSAGMNYKEMVSALGAMTLVEQDVARDTMFLTNLLKVLGGGNQEAAKAAGELGIEFSATALESKKLSGMVEEINQKLKGNKDALRRLFPDMDAYNGYLTFARVNSGDYQTILDKVNNSLGELDKAYEDVLANDTAHQFNLMKASMVDMSLTVGQLAIPKFQEWAKTLRDISNRYEELNKQHPEITDFVTSTAFDFGELAIKTAAVTYTVAKLIDAYQALKKAMLAIEGLTAAGALGAGGAALGGIGYGVYSIYQTFQEYGDEIKRNVSDMTSALESLYRGADESLKKFEGTTEDHLERTRKSMDAFWNKMDDDFGHSKWIDAYRNNADQAEIHWGRWSDAIITNIERVKPYLYMDIQAELDKFNPTQNDRGDRQSYNPILFQTDEGSLRGIQALEDFQNSMKRFHDLLKTSDVQEYEGNLARVGDQIYRINDLSKRAAGDGIPKAAQEIRALNTYTGDGAYKLEVYGDTLQVTNERIAGAVNHLDALAGVLGLSTTQTGQAIKETKEYLRTHSLTKDEVALAAEQINKWNQELGRARDESEAASRSNKELADSFEETARKAENAGKEIEAFYTGAMRTTKRFGGSVQESISEFGDIFSEAEARLGSYQNVLNEFFKYIQLMNRRIRAGADTTVLSMSQWIEQVLGITTEKLTQTTEQATRQYELGYEKWRALAVEYKDDAMKIMNEFWVSFARTQSLGLDTAGNAMDDYYRDMVDKLDRTARASKQSSLDSIDALRRQSDAVKGLATDWTASSRTIAIAAKQAKDAVTQISGMGPNRIRGFAGGGVTDHSIVMVGERGPELAALPVGTRILSHADMMQAAAGGVKGFADGGVVDEYPLSHLVEDTISYGMYGKQTPTKIIRWDKLPEQYWSTVPSDDGNNFFYEHRTAFAKLMSLVAPDGQFDYQEQISRFQSERGNRMNKAFEEQSVLARDEKRKQMAAYYAEQVIARKRLGQQNNAPLDALSTSGGEAAIIKNKIANPETANPLDGGITGIKPSQEAIAKQWEKRQQTSNILDWGLVEKVYGAVFGPYDSSITWGLSKRKAGIKDRPGGGYFLWEDSQDMELMAGKGPDNRHMLWDPIGEYWVASTGKNAAKAIEKLKLWYALERIQKTPASVVGFSNGGVIGGNDWLVQSMDELRSKAPKNGAYFTRGFVQPSIKPPKDPIPQIGYWDLGGSGSGGSGGGTGGSGGGNTDLNLKELPWMPQEGNDLIDLGIQKIWDRMAAATGSGTTVGGRDPYDGLVMRSSDGTVRVRYPSHYQAGNLGGYVWMPIQMADPNVFRAHWNLPLPSFADGGTTASRIVMVGERGPELAALPVGTRVMSHADMMHAAEGFANGGVVGMNRATQYLSSGLSDTPGGRASAAGATMNINSPLVNVQRVDASSQADVDKFIKQVSDVFKRQLSGLGLSLNAVGRA
ncbi:MAG: phage tail tape measure protein [Candidatus Omnitrophica bacterium]|nr:phage tail tape measure protein [Candidatus Omnitrophota bacterium]